MVDYYNQKSEFTCEAFVEIASAWKYPQRVKTAKVAAMMVGRTSTRNPMGDRLYTGKRNTWIILT